MKRKIPHAKGLTVYAAPRNESTLAVTVRLIGPRPDVTCRGCGRVSHANEMTQRRVPGVGSVHLCRQRCSP